MKGIGNLKPSVQLAGSRVTALPASESAPAWGQGRGGRPWRRKRASILARDKYQCQCEGCKARGLITMADEVDHIVPICQGGTDDDSNLRAINTECHKAKTARESQGC